MQVCIVERKQSTYLKIKIIKNLNSFLFQMTRKHIF